MGVLPELFERSVDSGSMHVDCLVGGGGGSGNSSSPFTNRLNAALRRAAGITAEQYARQKSLFREKDHPRVPAGVPEGGQFAPRDGGNGGGSGGVSGSLKPSVPPPPMQPALPKAENSVAGRRAPKGGAVSQLTGRFYEGGKLMPTTGRDAQRAIDARQLTLADRFNAAMGAGAAAANGGIEGAEQPGIEQPAATPLHDHFTTHLPSGQSIRWEPHPYRDSDDTTVMVPVSAIESGWGRGLPSMYIGPGVAGIEGRRAGVLEYLRSGKPLQASKVVVRPNGVVDFQDGRHRFAVLRDHGADMVAVTVAKEELPYLQQNMPEGQQVGGEGPGGWEPERYALGQTSAERRAQKQWMDIVAKTMQATAERVAREKAQDAASAAKRAAAGGGGKAASGGGKPAGEAGLPSVPPMVGGTAVANWKEEQHPRGNPENPGEFRKKDSAGVSAGAPGGLPEPPPVMPIPPMPLPQQDDSQQPGGAPPREPLRDNHLLQRPNHDEKFRVLLRNTGPADQHGRYLVGEKTLKIVKSRGRTNPGDQAETDQLYWDASAHEPVEEDGPFEVESIGYGWHTEINRVNRAFLNWIKPPKILEESDPEERDISGEQDVGTLDLVRGRDRIWRVRKARPRKEPRENSGRGSRGKQSYPDNQKRLQEAADGEGLSVSELAAKAGKIGEVGKPVGRISSDVDNKKVRAALEPIATRDGLTVDEILPFVEHELEAGREYWETRVAATKHLQNALGKTDSRGRNLRFTERDAADVENKGYDLSGAHKIKTGAGKSKHSAMRDFDQVVDEMAGLFPQLNWKGRGDSAKDIRDNAEREAWDMLRNPVTEVPGPDNPEILQAAANRAWEHRETARKAREQGLHFKEADERMPGDEDEAGSDGGEQGGGSFDDYENNPWAEDRPSAGAASSFVSSGDLGRVSRNAHQANLDDWEGSGKGVDSQFDISSLPHEVAQQFDAHGVASVDRLADLLSGGVQKDRSFFTAALNDASSGGSGLGLRTNSPFLVLGHPGKSIANGGIGAVIVDGHHSSSIPLLQKHFPNVRFIPASEAAERMKKFPPGQPVDHGGDDEVVPFARTGERVRYSLNQSLRAAMGIVADGGVAAVVDLVEQYARQKSREKGHWVTINGAHVLIGGDGNVRSGNLSGEHFSGHKSEHPRHRIALPPNSRKVTIQQAGEALDQMGYLLGKGQHNLKTRETVYPVKLPNGNVAMMSSDAIKALIYHYAEPQGAAGGTGGAGGDMGGGSEKYARRHKPAKYSRNDRDSWHRQPAPFVAAFNRAFASA